MSEASSRQVTALLRAWEAGQPGALDDLVPIVYRELKGLARRCNRGEAPDSLQTTALVHEAYLRLVGLAPVTWADRAHFFALSARIIRGILIDAARSRSAQKRGGTAERVTEVDLDQVPDMGAARAEEILAVHEALEHLALIDPRQAQVVELRFFVGLSVEEAAAVLKVSPQSVMRDWKLAKAWLRREIERGSCVPDR